jgi:SAM-dependent methyltransferase
MPYQREADRVGAMLASGASMNVRGNDRPSMPLVARACPICGSTDAATVFADAAVDTAKLDAFAFAARKMPEHMHHRLLRCASCDLLFASPIPTASYLTDAYAAAAFDSGDEARWAARTYGGLLRSVISRLPDREGALDVGAGDGAFLEELIAAGFSRVSGIEPSTAPLAAAQPTIRPLIRAGAFCAADHESASFSLVTCFQTIEHLVDPMEACRGFHRLLKPGGAVLVVGHNRRAFSARIMGSKSPIFDIEHLQLFSPTSARRLLAAAGFADIQIRHVVNRYPLHYWVKLSPLPTALKRSMIKLLKAVPGGSVAIPLPAGNLAAIGFRPR